MGRERDMNMYRSGSAPPTVEGSLSAVVGLPEDKLRSDPAYISYYYSNSQLNPRLPPPLLSKEDWKRESGRRTQGNVVGGERRDASLFSSGFGGKSESNVGQWGEDGLIGLPGLGFGSKQKSFAEVTQDDVTYGTTLPNHSSRPASRTAFVNGLESDSHFGSSKMVQRNGIPSSQTYALALGDSFSRSTTPDPQLSHRSPSPHIPPVGDGRSRNILRTEPADVAAALSAMTLSTNIPNMVDDSQNLFHLQVDKNPIRQQQERSDSNMHSAWNMYLNGPSTPIQNGRGNLTSTDNKIESPNSSFLNYGYNGYATSLTSPSMMGNQAVNLPPLFENMSLMDPINLQYMKRNDPLMDYDVNSYMELVNLQNTYLKQVLSPNGSQYGLPYFGKSATMNNNYYGNSTLGVDMAYPVSPLGRSFSPTSPFKERSMLYPSQLGSFGTRGMGSWQNMDGHFASTLLDEFKSNKTRCFELSEIAGHVVEFSADQYGSRYIQQKLETATLDEINMVFNEINPHALTLMTDVFGNYVIQKFFEHGTPAQIREFANHLIGNVLTLSLQMYGCRVIQKAIEVVKLDQQTKMVAELDGHVMRCVRDQNGNHVIQKCIECVPEEVIQFIISVFYDQVVTLSTHPYGCRVIQRVLEHCADPKTLKVVMDEIMQSVVMLAQDQYGNYVVQHVLEHGQPHERTAIVKQLIGQIVQMSQQKFASNVVEKCLSFGTPEERQILVDEMLGSTDENDPLQVMMKDQFANYVVQKVLETCDDQQLTLILNRIKVHLTALKKYTYGKHIVARVEKLVTAGEKRISTMAATYSS